MKKRILPALLILLPLAACNPTTPNPPPPQPKTTTAVAQPHTAIAAPTGDQNFDYYLLNLSWSPEFCHSHANAPECAQHLAFTLHGLWPQNNTGPFIQNCSTAPGPQNPTQYSDIYPDPGLLRHEWQTHGTCSGLSPDAFFTLARTATHRVSHPRHSLPTRPPDITATRSNHRPLPSRQPILSRQQHRHQLRQQLPHRRRSLHGQAGPTHRLRPHPFLPSQHRPHHTPITQLRPRNHHIKQSLQKKCSQPKLFPQFVSTTFIKH